MAYRVVALCDKCRAENALEFGVFSGGHRYDVLLCSEHAGPLNEAIKLGIRRDGDGFSAASGVTARLYDSRLRNIP